jgi:hypothetical protein
MQLSFHYPKPCDQGTLFSSFELRKERQDGALKVSRCKEEEGNSLLISFHVHVIFENYSYYRWWTYMQYLVGAALAPANMARRQTARVAVESDVPIIMKNI